MQNRDQYAHIFWASNRVEDDGTGVFEVDHRGEAFITIDEPTALANVHLIPDYYTCFELRPDKHKTPEAQFSWFLHKGTIIGAVYFCDNVEDQCFAIQNGQMVKTEDYFCNELTDEESIGDALENCLAAFASDFFGEKILVGFDFQEIPLAQVPQDIVDYVEEHLNN